MKVLIIDDDPIVLELARAVIQGLGHDVTTREQALGTTSVILEHEPDVVLVDVEMPAISGDDLVRVVREQALARRGVTTAFILFSGRRAADLERLALETGAVGSIEKTSSPASLASAFQRIVASLSADGTPPNTPGLQAKAPSRR